MSFKSSVIEMSMGQISSMLREVAFAPYSSRSRTDRRLLFDTAKCIGVFPFASLLFTFAPFLSKIFAFSKLLETIAKCKGVA